MTAPLDPSLLAWVRSFADPATAPTARAPDARLREAREDSLARRRREASEGRARTAAWLRTYLSDGEWHHGNDIRAASNVAGIRHKWIYEAMQRLCVPGNRDRQGYCYRLRGKGDAA